MSIANNVEATTSLTDHTANLVLKTTIELIYAITMLSYRKLDNLIKLETVTLAAFQKLLKTPNEATTS